MARKNMGIAAALIALTTATAFAPLAASADSRQSNKNTWRNLAIGSAVVGGYGLLHHNTTATLLGAGGAAYSANRYEQDRRSQSRANAWRNSHRYYHRYYRHR